MKKAVIITSVLSVTAAAVSTVLYICGGQGIFLTLAITFWTTAYHFVMRLAVGLTVNAVMHDRADISRPWFRQRGWEKKLYRLLRVKSWKGRVPTFQPDSFDLTRHTPGEVAQAMCQAELVHEIIFPLSFLPVFAAIWVGALPVFVVTSVLAGCMELVFIITQRFNRPRLIAMMKRRARSRG